MANGQEGVASGGNVRLRLTRYYAGEGRNNSVRIELPNDGLIEEPGGRSMSGKQAES